MYRQLRKERDERRAEFERLSVCGDVDLMRSKGIEALVLTKTLNFIRSDKYEQD